MDNNFQRLLERIKNGGDDNWDFFDANIGVHLESNDSFAWAKDSSLGEEPNEHFRDAAATILARSDFLLDDVEQETLIGKMHSDTNSFVRYWLANALYKRSNRHPEVVAMWQEACQQTEIPAGEFARELKAT